MSGTVLTDRIARRVGPSQAGGARLMCSPGSVAAVLVADGWPPATGHASGIGGRIRRWGCV